MTTQKPSKQVNKIKILKAHKLVKKIDENAGENTLIAFYNDKKLN